MYHRIYLRTLSYWSSIVCFFRLWESLQRSQKLSHWSWVIIHFGALFNIKNQFDSRPNHSNPMWTNTLNCGLPFHSDSNLVRTTQLIQLSFLVQSLVQLNQYNLSDPVPLQYEPDLLPNSTFPVRVQSYRNQTFLVPDWIQCEPNHKPWTSNFLFSIQSLVQSYQFLNHDLKRGNS